MHVRESVLKSKCKTFLQRYGWRVIHMIQTNENGITDTLIMRRGRSVFLEFKRQGEKPDPIQLYRHECLRNDGFEVHVIDRFEQIEQFYKL